MQIEIHIVDTRTHTRVHAESSCLVLVLVSFVELARCGEFFADSTPFRIVLSIKKMCTARAERTNKAAAAAAKKKVPHTHEVVVVVSF